MVQKAVLLTLIGASALLFWKRFGFVVHRIRQARPDADFRLGSLARRFWIFFSEVLCQSKVIRERPLPGLAHAFVFWAFCAFALVTLNHFASGFGWRFLDYGSGFGAFYYWLAFAFAAFCAISIAGLAFRRFVIRPRWLEPLSPESGLIAALIFILMATYMAQHWLAEEAPAGKAVWWLHTLALLSFIPIIPHTKHLHL